MQFIIKRDRKGKFLFASLQSEFAQELVKKGVTNHRELNTVIYQRGNSYYFKSSAALEVFKEIGGIWRISSIFKLFPKSWLDKIYDFIADHRYNWFGKRQQCMIPTPENRTRFLD